MRIGVSSLYLLGKPFSELARNMELLNAPHWEIMDEDTLALDRDKVTTLVELKASYGFGLSVHMPFADMNIASFNDEIRRTVMARLHRSLEFASRLEADAWVCHPGAKTGLSYCYPGEDVKRNLASIRELFKKGQDLGVEVMVENMPGRSGFLMKAVDEFFEFFETTPDLAIKLVLDLGHANMVGELPRFLDAFGRKIGHVHAHDNRGDSDSHNRIGDGTVDWSKVSQALRRMDYQGLVIVESVSGVGESLEYLKSLLT